MTIRYFIRGSKVVRPASRRTIYCDGGWGDSFRPSQDLHLSHWIPNRTPARFKANTSTEICMKFVERGDDIRDFDLVVNDHIDVDGVLAVFVLRYPEVALPNRRTLIEAAEIGDFWGWGEERAQALFQALILLKDRMAAAHADPGDIYRAGFDCVRKALSGYEFPEVHEGLAALRESAHLLDSGVVCRNQISADFTLFVVPEPVASGRWERCLHVPKFNVALSRASLLPPHIRARSDRERVQLVSVETAHGWFHDLWLPGYIWAETPTLRSVPGLTSTGDSNVHDFKLASLDAAASRLQREDRLEGSWSVARRLSPFQGLEGRGFPIVLSHTQGAAPVPSSHPPSLVAEMLAKAWVPAHGNG